LLVAIYQSCVARFTPATGGVDRMAMLLLDRSARISPGRRKVLEDYGGGLELIERVLF